MAEFLVGCPNCGVQLSASDEYIGRNVSCPECDTRFVITGEAELVEATYPKIEAGGQIGRQSHNYVPSATSHTAVQDDSDSGHVSNLIKVISAIVSIAVVGYNIWVHFHNAKIRMEGGEYQYTIKNIVKELAEQNLTQDGIEIMKVYDFTINSGGKDCKATIDVRDKKNGDVKSVHCTYKAREITGGQQVEVYDFKLDEVDVSSLGKEHMLTVDELRAEVSQMLTENLVNQLKEDGCKNVSVNVRQLSLIHDAGNRYNGSVEIESRYDDETETLKLRIAVMYDGATIAYELKNDE